MVRGAYWNSEKQDGHLYVNKKETDFNYNKSILFLSKNNINTQIILATHNQESINLGTLLNHQNNKRIFQFAHLLGMREKVYKDLVKGGEDVHVYIPWSL